MKVEGFLLALGLTPLLATAAHAQSYYVTTVAGSRTAGSKDGTGAEARFYYPYCVAVDAVGTLYVTDTYNRTLRKITPSGNVSTVAGMAGIQGDANGTGNAARFFFPVGIVVDEEGVLYVADHGSIRKVSPEGTVTTLAGVAGVRGDVDGIGSEARFGGPYGLALDAAGNVIVGDNGNSTIRRVTTNGVVTTLTLRAPNEQFGDVRGISIDAVGNIYVADGYDHVVRKRTPDGAVTILAGTRFQVGYRDGVGGGSFVSPSGKCGCGPLWQCDSGGLGQQSHSQSDARWCRDDNCGST